MILKDVSELRFKEGDLVTVSSIGDDHHFCIIGFKENRRGEKTAVLKGLFGQTFIIEKPLTELKSLLLRGRL